MLASLRCSCSRATSKLAGAPVMVRLFAAIGVAQWFRYITGLIEVVSAPALLVPALAPFGALLLALTMLGAIATHLLIVGGSPAPPGALLLGSLAIVWARRERLSACGRQYATDELRYEAICG